MKAIPKIQKFMTTTPHAINGESSVEEALKVMDKNKIRHLPVMLSNTAYGLVSDRDLRRFMALSSVNPQTIKVRDICEEAPYQTNPNAMINDVAEQMVERKIGSALVLDNGKLVGIFTTTDACQALVEICNQRFHG